MNLHLFLRFAMPGGRKMWLSLLFYLFYTLLVVWIDDHAFPAKRVTDAQAALYVGVIMGILLVFRTNSAYDRWWEARKLWGQLVNDLRNLSIKAKEYALLNSDEQVLLARLLVGFALSLRDHLRGQVNRTHIPEAFRQWQESQHVPLAIAEIIVHTMRTWNRAGRFTDTDMLMIDRHTRSLMDICGGLERISRSPIAGTYKMLIGFGFVLYCLGLPWVLVPTCGPAATMFCMLSTYFGFALELLAEEVEEPFGTSPNDLPLDKICEGIDTSVRQVLCGTDVTSVSGPEAQPSAQSTNVT